MGRDDEVEDFWGSKDTGVEVMIGGGVEVRVDYKHRDVGNGAMVSDTIIVDEKGLKGHESYFRTQRGDSEPQILQEFSVCEPTGYWFCKILRLL